MKGALLELKAKGAEDLNLIGNPSISFFKSTHRRHTNFTKFERKNIFYGDILFGQKSTVKVEKYGDLLTKCWLQIKLSATGNDEVSWINSIGNYMIDYVIFKIGGIEIAKLSGDYIDIFHKYYFNTGHYNTYSVGVKNIQGHDNTSLSGEQILFIPLPFWFTKDVSQAIPLISMQYSTVELEIQLKPLKNLLFSGLDKSELSNLVNFNEIKILECYLFCEYIYLDTQERQLFTMKDEIDYLIEQMQEMILDVPQSTSYANYNLTFNNPVKELIWFYRNNFNVNLNLWHIYSHNFNTFKPIESEPLDTVSLQLNGLERFETRNADYFRVIVPIYSHNSSDNHLVYFYNFALNCDSIQPSGSLNFNKIDDAIMSIKYTNKGDTGIGDGTLFILAINYNFLKIKKGMVGILYQ
jgi:hypothetical protein